MSWLLTASDALLQIKFCARRNNGIHEPETRLIPLIFPIVIGITATVMYGYQHDNPFKMHWFGIVFEYSAQYFAFIAASVAGQTYLLDAYPERAGSVLVVSLFPAACLSTASAHSTSMPVLILPSSLHLELKLTDRSFL